MTQQQDFKGHVWVQFRPDGIVRITRVDDYGWTIADPHWFSVAKSARGALMSRRGHPLLIPKNWRRGADQITLTLKSKIIFRHDCCSCHKQTSQALHCGLPGGTAKPN
jgi:hypothetical protein